MTFAFPDVKVEAYRKGRKGRIDILASLPINTLLKQICNSKSVATE